MKTRSHLSLLMSLLACGVGEAGIAESAVAQISPDNTTNTQVDANGNDFTIEQGDRAGNNLFHSFQDFSIPNGGSAIFNNSVEIQNIFSRVTGGNISNIDGLIRANGEANLFLINPNGITFGTGASLELGGSFYGSTADSILFSDGVEFSASDPEVKPILSINAPIGLRFRDNPQPIINRSRINNVGLQVNAGKNITLVGGELDFAGGILTASGGRIELGAISTAGEIAIADNGSLIFPDSATRGDINLTDNASVSVTGNGGGFININARNLTLSEQSQLFAGIAENNRSAASTAGDIKIDATESVTIIGELSTADPTAPFNDFLAQLTTERDNAAGIRNNVGLPAIRRNDGSPRSSALGNGGDIIIKTPLLELSDVAVIDTSLVGEGNAGDIKLDSDRIFLNGGVLLTQVRGFELENIKEKAVGDAGDININTGSFILNKRSGILADVQAGAIGNGGNIIVNASEKVAFNEFNLLLTQLGVNAVGSAGDIDIAAKSISFDRQSLLLSDVQSGARGDAGDITLEVPNNISLDESSQILTQVQENGVGNGGDIAIAANNLFANNNSQIQANTQGTGNAGNIKVRVKDTIAFTGGSGFNTELGTNIVGNAGNIEINSAVLKLDNSQIRAKTFGSGNAGNITLEIADNIVLDNNSLLSAEAIGNSDGGNIDIDTNFIIAIPDRNSDIVANARQGNGGNITIAAESIVGLEPRKFNPPNNTNDIDASSARGAQFDGNIEIITPDIDALQSVAELPDNVVEPQASIDKACAANRDVNATNRLIIQSRGRIPDSPTAPLQSDSLLSSDANSTIKDTTILTSKGNITPARGIAVKENGQIVLTASSPSRDRRYINTGSNCI